MDNEKLFEFMEKMYVEMHEGFKGLKDEIRKNTESIINLEAKMIDRTESLFDGYKQNTESIKQLEEKIDDMQMDINTLSSKTSKNENRIIEFSKHLKEVK